MAEHLLLLVETENSNREMEIINNWAEKRRFQSLKTRIGPESFFWQEIGSQIRKVYEILVHPADQRLLLIRKNVKVTVISIRFGDFGPNCPNYLIDFLTFF